MYVSTTLHLYHNYKKVTAKLPKREEVEDNNMCGHLYYTTYFYN